MRVPKDSLDDFIVRADKSKPEPPLRVSPRISGEIEVLKPLTKWEDLVRARAAASRRKFHWPALTHLSWYHRSLAVSGACALFAFVFGMSVYFGIYGQPVEQAASTTDVLMNRQKKRTPTPPKARNPFDHLAVTNSPVMSDEPVIIPAIDLRPRSFNTGIVRAAVHVRHLPRVAQLATTKFIPTTLIIYVEKGEVKSRIEPQLTAAYKRPLNLPN
jgi:hypothetical protein